MPRFYTKETELIFSEEIQVVTLCTWDVQREFRSRCIASIFLSCLSLQDHEALHAPKHCYVESSVITTTKQNLITAEVKNLLVGCIYWLNWRSIASIGGVNVKEYFTTLPLRPSK